MNKLLQIKKDFHTGQIDKGRFIEAMSAEHACLFSYSESLKDANITEIKIRHDGIVAEFKDPRISMICPPGDMRNAPFEVLNFNDYEHDEVQAVRHIISQLGGSSARFIDIGANAGFYSLALAHYFPGIEGIAFEPIPDTYTTLKRNFELNGLTTVRPLDLGLSDKSGEIIFYSYPSLSAAAGMTRILDGPDVKEVRCEVVRLDDYCFSNDVRTDFIKCDVEGAELLVFRGAEKILARDRPAVFAEMLRKWSAKYDYHPNDLIHFFQQLGYACFVIDGSRLHACPLVSEQTKDTNFIFLHHEKHAELLADWVD